MGRRRSKTSRGFVARRSMRPAVSTGSPQIDALILQVDQLLARGQHEEAFQLAAKRAHEISEAATTNEDRIGCALLFERAGRALLRAGRHDEAIQLLESVTGVDDGTSVPADPWGIFATCFEALSDAFHAVGRNSEALNYLFLSDAYRVQGGAPDTEGAIERMVALIERYEFEDEEDGFSFISESESSWEGRSLASQRAAAKGASPGRRSWPGTPTSTR